MAEPLGAYVGLYKALTELGMEKMGCEHPQHADNPWGNHSGSGVWYIGVNCQMCGHKIDGLALVCEAFKESVQSGDVLIQCQKCGKSMDARNHLVVKGRRDY